MRALRPELLMAMAFWDARTRALFRLSRDGDIEQVNEAVPIDVPGPSMFATFNVATPVLAFHAALPRARREQIATLLASELTPAWVQSGPPAATRDQLRAHLGLDSAEGEWRGPVFGFPADHLVDDDAEVLEVESPEIFASSFPNLVEEAAYVRPCLALLHAGQVVSACYSARRGEWVHEAGVDTLPAFQGRHFGSRVCRAWARAVRRRGAVPVYSTSFDNEASLGLARSLGLVHLGTDLHFPLNADREAHAC